MNSTELKTLRQSLFLSVAEAAALHQVRERVYRYWESGEWAIPNDVAARMTRLDDAADTIADNIASANKYRHDKSRTLVLFRYASDEDLQAMTVRTIFNDYMHDIPAAVYAAGIDRARQDIKRDGDSVRIVTMDRAAYSAWLAQCGDPDTIESRARWCATVIDPPTRAGKAARPTGDDETAQASGEPTTETKPHGR